FARGGKMKAAIAGYSILLAAGVLGGQAYAQSGGAPAGGVVVVRSLVCSPSTVRPVLSGSCRVTLSGGIFSGGVVVALQSSLPEKLGVLVSVTVLEGFCTSAFIARIGNFDVEDSVRITASLNGSSQTASLKLLMPYNPSNGRNSPF